MLDATDQAILELLRKNARLQWREIGEQVHLTGQAVANRIRRMEEAGIIEGYEARINEKQLGNAVTAFITILMKSNDHMRFRQFVFGKPEVYALHRISGEGCYLLIVHVETNEALHTLLDELLQYANYRVQISVNKMK